MGRPTSRQRMMFAVLSIATRKIFNNFVGTKVDRVRRTYIEPSVPERSNSFPVVFLPAPTTTLDIPRHNVRNPSNLEIVERAFDMPV